MRLGEASLLKIETQDPNGKETPHKTPLRNSQAKGDSAKCALESSQKDLEAPHDTS